MPRGLNVEDCVPDASLWAVEGALLRKASGCLGSPGCDGELIVQLRNASSQSYTLAASPPSARDERDR